MNCDPHWTAYLTALLTPAIGVLAALIARWQWKLAQNKLKLDLFDRRLEVYEAAQSLVSSIMTSGIAKEEEVFKYMVAIRKAKWLLDDAIAQYLRKELYFKVIELQRLAAELEGVPVGEERTKNIREQRDVKEWLLKQYEVMDENFSSFLQLRH